MSQPQDGSAAFVAPEGWEQESPTLYLHGSGVRIERRIYRHREAWILVPVDLDRAMVEFAPDGEGLERAFATFANGALEQKETGVTKEVREAREAARRDENPDDSSEEEEKDEEEDA